MDLLVLITAVHWCLTAECMWFSYILLFLLTRFFIGYITAQFGVHGNRYRQMYRGGLITHLNQISRVTHIALFLNLNT